MKRSPSSSCSSSSSCIETEINPIELANNKPKIKRARAKKTAPNQDKISNNEGSNAGRRSSIYRGVTRHRWTGRYEAHLWDKSTYNSSQNKKGRQIYLGAYDDEDAAARTYDLAALKYWGPGTILNFALETYTKDIEAMEKMTKEEYLASLRRQSSGFSRGVSKYRGVARHHHNGRWEARIGRVFGNKYLYLGTYGTQEEAAAAYDMAAIEYRGPNAVTNFDASVYADRLKEKKTKDGHSLKADTPSPCLSENQGRPRVKADKPEEVQQHHQEEPKQVLVQTQDLNLEIPYEGNEHPWSLCMDPEFHPLPLQDVTYPRGGGDLPYLFGETGFQDNVEFIFDSPMGETLFFDTDSFFENSNVKEETENNKGGSETGQIGQPSVSSPSSSTTTLGYCN